MIDWIPAAVLVAIIGTVGTVYGVRKTRQSAKEEIRIRDSENLAKRVNDLWQRVDKQDEKIRKQDERIQAMVENENRLKRYIRVLVDFITLKGLEPPEPPNDYTL